MARSYLQYSCKTCAICEWQYASVASALLKELWYCWSQQLQRSGFFGSLRLLNLVVLMLACLRAADHIREVATELLEELHASTTAAVDSLVAMELSGAFVVARWAGLSGPCTSIYPPAAVHATLKLLLASSLNMLSVRPLAEVICHNMPCCATLWLFAGGNSAGQATSTLKA